IFLECAWEALETSGYVPDDYEGAIGVYAGSGPNTYLLNNLCESTLPTALFMSTRRYLRGKLMASPVGLV
ncbi:MAG: hypothetical protein GVY17_08465, partial [Cyanobacteria bacterium]|nr:hypothetical protein [Cyanobacteria bacterium GSL.Bin21]